MADAIGIAATGLGVDRHWLDAIADNIANVNTAEPTSGAAFQARYIIAQAGAGTSGVYVAGAAFGSAAGRVTHDPATRSRMRTATCACPTSTSARRWAHSSWRNADTRRTPP